MKIKLKNGKVSIDGYEPTKDVKVQYKFELGTNHLKPVLTISNGVTTLMYKGKDPIIDMDFECKDTLTFIVKLYDAYNHVIKTYQGIFKYLKYYSLDDRMDYIDVFEENERLKNRIIELEEKGEVI